MSVLYGGEAIEHRLSDSGAALLVTDPANAPRFDRQGAPDVLVLEDATHSLQSEILAGSTLRIPPDGTGDGVVRG
jgi:hypothetical protein